MVGNFCLNHGCLFYDFVPRPDVCVCNCLQTQMHSLIPFGADLLSKERVEDNMTWNFVAGLTVACEILESYGCVVRVISPRCSDAALGSGGTRLELWLPSIPGTTLHNLDIPTQEA